MPAESEEISYTVVPPKFEAKPVMKRRLSQFVNNQQHIFDRNVHKQQAEVQKKLIQTLLAMKKRLSNGEKIGKSKSLLLPFDHTLRLERFQSVEDLNGPGGPVQEM